LILDDLIKAENNETPRREVTDMTALTVVLKDETAHRLDALAERLDRSRLAIALDAIEDYIAREEDQISEIEAGLRDADAGDFASETEISGVMSKYVKPVVR
jgi:predicted transcriptional regulator